MAHALRMPELRRRLLFTAMILAVYRLGSWLPTPGVDSNAVGNFLNSKGSTIFGLLNLLSGSSLSRLSVCALGIVPYIRHAGFSQATSRALGGTSVLIVVGVALDTMRQMESQIMARRYEGFLKR